MGTLRLARRLAPAWVALVVLGCTHDGPSPAERSSPVGADWLASAQRELARREYRASENGEGLQAPNRAHDLRTYFEKSGIRVHDRTAGGSPELLRLSLSGVGRGEALAATTPGEQVVSDGNRVEIRRPGLVEWYVNSAEGLEQGFTLEERPAGDGPLVLELAVAGGAHPSLRGEGVVFETRAGRKLDYGKLAAADAAARSLPARFELAQAQRIRIVVDDTGARYPLVIDPLLAGAADTQFESDQVGASFRSVASAGDVNGDGYDDVIVGAPLYDNGQSEEGAAFVFLGNGSGRAVLARQRRGDGSGIGVEPWGWSASDSSFAAELRASHPEGGGRVRAEFEACPNGVPFGDASCTSQLSPGWLSVGAAPSDVLLSQAVMGLTPNVLYRWRARVLHAPATGRLPVNPAHGPWRRPTAQASEADIRVIPEPEGFLQLLAGLGALLILRRRRAR